MVNEDDKVQVVLSQWQTCVEMANSISQRRDVMNNLFVTLNLAIIAAVSVIFNFKTIFLEAAGIALCIIWIQFICNFKMLNEEKYKIINEMEQNLPFQPFDKEWENLSKNQRYKEETKLEKILPIAFIIIYIVAVLLLIIMKCH